MKRNCFCVCVILVILVSLGTVAAVIMSQQAARYPARFAELAWQARVRDCIVCLGFSESGDTLAAADQRGQVVLLDAATGARSGNGQGPPVETYGADLSPDLKYLATEFQIGGELQIRNVQTRGLTSVPVPDHVKYVDFSPHGKLLAIGTPEAVSIWDMEQRKTIKVIKHPESVSAAMFSPDGAKLATQERTTWSIRVWDTRTWRLLKSYPGKDYYFSKGLLLGWGPEGRSLITRKEDWPKSRLEVWDIHTGGVWQTTVVKAHTVWAPIALSPDGRLLACGKTWMVTDGEDASVTVWDLSTGYQSDLAHESLKAPGWVSVAFSPDGKMLAAGFGNGMVYVWRISYPPKEPSLLDTLKSIISRPKKAPPTPAKAK